MKKIRMGIVLALTVALFLSGAVHSADMRISQIEAAKKKAAVLEKAALEKKRAQAEAKATLQNILADKKKLEHAIAELRKQNLNLETANQRLETEYAKQVSREESLHNDLKEVEGDVRELAGFVRVNARDLEALLKQSRQSAFVKNRGKVLLPLTAQTQFPRMNDIRAMADLYFDEIIQSGEVCIRKGPFIDRAGKETEGDILVLGNFSSAYRLPDETGFLLYSDESQRFFALSKLPSRRKTKQIRAYMSGQAEAVPIDISRGAALRQLTHKLSLWEQIPKGGPIVWPILGVALLASLIILERIVYIMRKNINAERFAYNVCIHAARQEWDECTLLCEQKQKKPLPRVLLAGLTGRRMSREDLENVLQEAILNEIPRLERFLSTLGMLAAIAPLLGLLGTVTGMINTFHVITYFGAGDPRMMSGGISEALVTTMLGLATAIPIMLSHTLLFRKVETMIARMEEKSVTLVNTIFKYRENA